LLVGPFRDLDLSIGVKFPLLLVAIVLLSPVLLPVVRFDTNVAPPCARERIPCPLGPDPPNGSPVFWSLTAYYFGAGTYFTPNRYGFIGFGWFFIGFLVALLLAGVLVIKTQNQEPSEVLPVRETSRNNQEG
jgi:hypothetical protein